MPSLPPHTTSEKTPVIQAPSNWAIRGMLPCTILLAAVVVLGFVAIAPLALWLQGLEGLQPAALAGLFSLMAGVAVLAVSHQPSIRDKPLVAMLVAMAMRMIPLLAVAVIIVVWRDRSENLYFVCYLVVFYIATLAVETYVSVQLAQSASISPLRTIDPQA